ncbi:MAG: HEAT repeat domain-containing protein, partial [Phycisphaerae bacterium]|nr:HEAT repeat domain-containing protein [Phycisphaerae bacterium]
LSNPKSQADRITAALESIGNSNLPDLQRAYKSSDPRVAFYTAYTAARLSDSQGLSILGKIATDDSSPYQLPATSALVEMLHSNRSTQILGNQFLRHLLDSRNDQVRIRAYQGLARNAERSIVPVRFERRAEFSLDVVLSKGPPLIYVQTGKKPHIVLFGPSMRCRVPFFYLSGDKLLTINSVPASAQDPESEAGPPEKLSLLRLTASGDIALRLQSSPDVVSLIKTLGSGVEPDYTGVHHGLGMDYSQVVGTLHGLWKDKALYAPLQNEDISAGFVLQQSPGVSPSLSGPQRPETAIP